VLDDIRGAGSMALLLWHIMKCNNNSFMIIIGSACSSATVNIHSVYLADVCMCVMV
jgi:hypothetical protein